MILVKIHYPVHMKSVITWYGEAPGISLVVSTYPSEKVMEFVSWDYYSQYMEKNMFQTTNQYTITWIIPN